MITANKIVKTLLEPDQLPESEDPDADIDPAEDIRKLADFRGNMRVMARLHTETPYESVSFDATYWFQEAPDALIRQWAEDKWMLSPIGNSCAKVVASRNKKLGLANDVGYAIRAHGVRDVSVNEEDVYHFIKWNRPHLYAELIDLQQRQRAEEARLQAAGHAWREANPDQLPESEDPDAVNDETVKRMVDTLPSRLETAIADACDLFDKMWSEWAGSNPNPYEIAEDCTSAIVDEHDLETGNELLDVRQEQEILQRLIQYAERTHPECFR